MKLLREWIEVLDCCAIGRQQFELCATALAYHDDTSNELVVYRDAFLREPASYGPEEYAYPRWLPDADTVRLLCAHSLAAELAEMEFKSWTALLRKRMEQPAMMEESCTEAEDRTFEREMWDALAV